MFEYKLIDDDNSNDDYQYYTYYYKDTLSNNQTIEFKFWSYNDKNIYTLSMEIFSKRKRKSKSFLDTTGKCGLEGLLLARLVLICFIDFIKESTNKQTITKIVIYGSDSRRTKIYKYYLNKLGFTYKRTPFQDMGMCIEIVGEQDD